MSEVLRATAEAQLDAPTIQRVLAQASLAGSIDPDVRTFAEGVLNGTPKQQLRAELGYELYDTTRQRIVSFANNLNGSN